MPANTISIAMATYNGEPYISEQLQTLATQTLLPNELVVCDDGSSDATVSLIDAFAKSAPFAVRLHVNSTRLGYRANFMKAAELCCNDLIAFCDQDDVWRHDKLELSLSAFTDGVVLTHHNAAVINADGKITRRYWICFDPNDPTVTGSPLMYLSPPGFSIVFRRELMAFVDLWPMSIDHEGMVFAHDTWIFFLGSLLGNTAFIDVDLVRYRQHSGNVYGVRKYAFLGIPKDVITSQIIRVIQSRLGASAKWYRLQSRSARIRANLIKALLLRVGETRAERLSRNLHEYEQIARHLEQRGQIYESTKLSVRLSAFRALLKVRAYRFGPKASFEKKAFFRDLFLGIPFGGGSESLSKD